MNLGTFRQGLSGPSVIVQAVRDHPGFRIEREEQELLRGADAVAGEGVDGVLLGVGREYVGLVTRDVRSLEPAAQIGAHDIGAFDELLFGNHTQHREPDLRTEVLDAEGPAYIGGILEMANARLFTSWANLTIALRIGCPHKRIGEMTDERGMVYERNPADGLLHVTRNRIERQRHKTRGGKWVTLYSLV